MTSVSGEHWASRQFMAGFYLAIALIVAAKAARTVGVSAGGLVDVLPSLGFSLALTFLFARRNSPRAASLVALAAGVVYELSQLRVSPWFDSLGRTFDALDLVASLVGAAIGYRVVQWIRNRKATTVQGAA